MLSIGRHDSPEDLGSQATRPLLTWDWKNKSCSRKSSCQEGHVLFAPKRFPAWTREPIALDVDAENHCTFQRSSYPKRAFVRRRLIALLAFSLTWQALADSKRRVREAVQGS